MPVFFVFLIVTWACLSSVVAQQDEFETLIKEAEKLRQKGNFATGENVALRALANAKGRFGPSHPHIGLAQHVLAGLYRGQGRFVEAEILYKRSLTIAEKTLGLDHVDVSATLNNLAGLYRAQGRLYEAEPLYKRSLTIDVGTLGSEHPAVGTVLNNLAGLYEKQGRFAEAEPLYKRSLLIHEKTLGQHHPYVGTTLNNLAVLYQRQSQFAKALAFYKRSLSVHERASRKEHPRLGRTLNNLGTLYQSQKRFVEAEAIYKQALSIREKVYGRHHPIVATTLNNLADLYSSTDRFSEATNLLKRSAMIRRETLGPDHYLFGQSLNNVARILEAQGSLVSAETYYKQALSIEENAFGRYDPKLRITLSNLAALYSSLGRKRDEVQIRDRLLRIPPPGTRHLPVYFATTRSRVEQDPSQESKDDVVFGSEASKQLSLGRVIMQVPAEAIIRHGEDRADNFRLDRGRQKLTAADVFKRVRHRHLNWQTLTTSIRASLGRAARSRNRAIIFIHGFNVDFDEATKRLSQVAFDLEFDGALIVFSWPSLGNPVRYLSDKSRADKSVDHFVTFLDQISADLPGVTLHVMAHSMGNRILTRAVHKIARRPKGAKRPKLGEIILAHADATLDWCAKLGKARDFVRGITNYANSDDAALRLSSGIRLGESRCGLNPKAYDGIETIDTTGMGGKRSSLFSVMFGAKNHHGVFANDPLLFGDISRLIASGQRPAHERTPEFAIRKDKASGIYWAFDPSRVLGAISKFATAD